jgi:hypothetical protein
MRSTFLILALGLFASTAFAAVKPTYFDYKPATQKMIEYQAFTNLAVAASTTVASDIQGPTSAAALVVTAGLTNPDSPRNLTITPGGSTGDVGTCTVTVAGTDYLNHAITEAFAFSANATTATVGNKAFKTVSSLSFAASCEDAPYTAHWNVGVGEKIGLKRCMDKAGHILHSTLNGAKEATAPTMAADASTVSLNTADFNGTMNGADDFELFFMQNFRCVR